METPSKKVISVLNDLLQINNDRVEGYKTAIGETEEGDLKRIFERFRNQSEQFAVELRSEIVRMGEDPVEGTRTDGKLYRVWMDIKSALTGRDRKTILSSCEAGEDVALNNYDEALQRDVILPSNLIDLIKSQKNQLQTAHDEVKSLRDLARGA